MFGKEHIGSLLGDREFIGPRWFKWLDEEKIPFVMRTQEAGQYISNSRGKFVKMKDLFHSLAPGETVHLGIRKLGKISTCICHISAARHHETGELLVVAHSADIENACSLYGQRWQIETMFRAFKTSGFNLESTRITDPDKLETLTASMALAFALAYYFGDMDEKDKTPEFKKHGYRSKSVFRRGMEIIAHLLMNFRRIFRRELKKIFSKIKLLRIKNEKVSEIVM